MLKAIRKRAGREGDDKFGEVKQEEVMRHFNYENTFAAESKQPGKARSKKGGRTCNRFNSEDGCSTKFSQV